MIRFYSKSELKELVSLREGETKVGEVIQVAHSEEDLENFLKNEKCRYFILGVPEDIGPRANHGKPGSDLAFHQFLISFLNHQANRFFPKNEIVFVGRLPIKHIQQGSTNDSIQRLRSKTSHIDSALYPVIQRIVSHQKIPIVIGGGHNNAYPNIKGSSFALNQPISAINLDPHADFRALEGRHSGNGFSYAWEEDLLKEYHVFGLNSHFNSEPMLMKMDECGVKYTLFNPDFCESKSFRESLDKALASLKGEHIGVEIDLDSIAHFPVSAMTPDGISLQRVKEFAQNCGQDTRSCYLHICEGSPVQMENGNILVGKSISSIILSFILGKNKTFHA